MHEGCGEILEGIVYLAAAASASTGKSKLWFIICNSAHHRAVCVSFCLLPIKGRHQQQQKPSPGSSSSSSSSSSSRAAIPEAVAA